MKDELIRISVANGQARAFITQSKNTAEKARQIHASSPVVTAAHGRLLSAAAMMGMTLGEKDDKLSIIVKGSGPVGSILVTANSQGQVKGIPENPQVEVANKANGKLDVAGLIGPGTITVVKDMGAKEPFSGTVELLSSEIAEDLAYYYLQSEQTPSALALGVHIASNYRVEASGGYLIQMLPGSDDLVAAKIEEKVIALGPVSELFLRGYGVDSLADALFSELGYEITERLSLDYVCSCSEDRMKALLLSLGKEELLAMKDEDGGAELVCHFCNSTYYFSENDLKSLIEFLGG